MKNCDFKEIFFDEDLLILNNIRFTPREIDMLACLLKLRSTKKIATLLSIYPKTVRNHLHNIMTKMECNSRDSIIDFMEKSEKISLLKAHYSALALKATFEQSLKEISKIKRETALPCKLIYWTETALNDSLVKNIQTHLKLAGISTSLELRINKPILYDLLYEPQKDYYKIYVLPKALMETPQPSAFPKNKTLSQLPQSNYSSLSLFLTFEKLPDAELYAKELTLPLLDWSMEESYFSAFFNLLVVLFPNLTVDKIVAEFKDKHNTKNEHTQQKIPQVIPTGEKTKSSYFYQRWGAFILACFLITLIGTVYIVYSWNQKNQETEALRSDLIIPIDLVFLNRQDLLTQIDNAFNSNEGIQTVALVGIGGSGKTTLAREYARQQNAPLIWEINAETKSNLLESFENLGHVLAKTEEDKRTLRDLIEIKNSVEREKRLVELVKGHLKSQSNWFLIYDNVEKFTDVQKYFPLDPNTWGTGRVILTTRDSNIENNKYVNHSLQIGELNEIQKLDLFTKIMFQNTKSSFDVTQIAEVKNFLKNIPPFPLDVSVASYYIKMSNTPYDKYLEELNKNNPDLTNVQHEILKESGDYTKTRYSIVTLSLQKLMESHKDFADLMLFVSLLDSQNIPKDLLGQYKDRNLVDSFIYHLKKYSLITTEASDSPPNLTFSIHRNTKDISLSYLTQFLKLNKGSPFLTPMIYAMDDYVDQVLEQEDFARMRLMAPHLEKFLTHDYLLTDLSKGILGSKLGSIYYFINDDKSKQILRDSLKILERNSSEHLSPEDISRLARSFLHIGAVYTELRLYKEAEALFEKAIHIYGEESTKSYIHLSWALSHLGNVHRRTGDYDKARTYLEKSVQLNKQHGGNKQRTARTLAYLGSVYRGLGFYQKAIDTLEESLAIYNKNYSNDHFRIGWTLTRLGNVYSDLGDFKQAKQCFEKGLHISKKYFPEDHMSMALTVTYLGICYKELREYEKSRDVLEESLKIHQKYFDANYRRMGWILFHLATTYKALGRHSEAQKMYNRVLEIYANYCNEDDIETAGILRNMAKICLGKNRLEEAEDFINRSLKILQSRQHIDAYRSLEVLGEIYVKKYGIKNTVENQNLKIKALNLFDQALKITEKNFQKNSTHIERIKARIKSMQE